MNKHNSQQYDVSESESDDSVNVLAAELKKLIECDVRQNQKNLLNVEIKPPKLRPSVVHRAFKKNVTSTPLVAKGYKHFFASDSSLSPIRSNETRVSNLRKSGNSYSINSINSKKDEFDADLNHDNSKENSKTIISNHKNNINSRNNVTPEVCRQDYKKPLVTSSSLKFLKKSALKNTNNKFSNNALDNGEISEVINKSKTIRSLRSTSENKETYTTPKTDEERSSSKCSTGRKDSHNNINKHVSPKITSINTSKKTNRNSSSDNKMCHSDSSSSEREALKSPSRNHSSRKISSSHVTIFKKPSITIPNSQKNIENFDTSVIKNVTPNMSKDENSLLGIHKSRSSLRRVSLRKKNLNSDKTPDNDKTKTTRDLVKNVFSKGTGKSLLPVPISRYMESTSNDRKITRHRLQSQKILQENKEYVERNNKMRSKSVDFIHTINLKPKIKQLSKTAIENRTSDNIEAHTNREASGNQMETVNKIKPPVPKPRNKKTTTTNDIHVSKPGQVNTVNKPERLSKFIDKLISRRMTESSSSNPKPVLSRSVQTSYRRSSVNKYLNPLQEQPNHQEIQTQTSYKYAPIENDSSDSSISNYTRLIEECAQGVNLFDSLKPEGRFSSSIDDYAFLDNSKKPWRLDETLNLPTRSSIHLSFIKNSKSIKADKEAKKQLRQYSALPNVTQHSIPKQIDSDESCVSNCSDQGIDKTVVNAIETAENIEDDNESLNSCFLPHSITNSLKKTGQPTPVVEDVPIEDVPIENVPNDQGITTAISHTSIAEKHLSNDPVREWVANVNNQYRNSDDESECCFYENGPTPIHSTQKTQLPKKNTISKVAKALFQTETENFEKDKYLHVILNRIDASTHNKENDRTGNIPNQFTELGTRLNSIVEGDNIEKIGDDNVFKVPLMERVPQSKKKKNNRKSTPAFQEASIESNGGDITGLRRSTRTRRQPSRKFVPLIIINNLSQKDKKFLSGLVCDSSISTLTTSSILQSNHKGEHSRRTKVDGRASSKEKMRTRSCNRVSSTPEKDINHSNKHNRKNKKSSANGSLDTKAKKKKQDDYPGGTEPEVNQTQPTPVHNTTVNTTEPTENNTGQRQNGINRSLANDLAETNPSMMHYSQIIERDETTISDSRVNINKEAERLEIIPNHGEINHDSHQYSKPSNPSKCISSDSGRSTLLRSSMDENIKTGRISKTKIKRKVGPKKRTKSLVKEAENVTNDTNDIDGIDEKYIEVHSETGAHKLKYIEQNPRFNQRCDNLKYSDPLDHTNGASMVYVEIPPGEIKKKHTNKKNNLFYCVIEGCGRVFLQDEVTGIKKKSRFIIPTGLCYSIINDSSSESLLLACVKMPVS
ncbi:MATH and LRR domain-containing protein PFE0570w-like isoform X2 [Diorhabda sublineata]|uniref:MATH and LRR domain-containing protein PFE0570w-like isoform X2 n=1 Tax=Diorhabda sublineata TaxID=1163346 RepID=UPI0024E16250|nr:MATH and LRR domain-containing protein PFE0570w-like isoform X2 [Diorhabda sublineata]